MRVYNHKIRGIAIRLCAATLTVVLSAILIASSFSANAYTFSADISLYSSAAILYNVETEQVVYEKNADTAQMPGHLAQIMTAIIVLENCDDLDGTTITANHDLYAELYSYDESDDVRYADIDDGDVLTVREYLYALMLTSSSEAALILADYFGGSSGQAGFVTMMNDKAQELGCTATTFQNPTGLYDTHQTSTARDLLTITNYALSLDDFEEIATTQAFTPTTKNSENHGDGSDWIWTHSNTMMDSTSDYYYEGAEGIKTGNLNNTGRSIITKATKDGTTYIVVLLNAPFNDEDGDLQYYHLEDAATLLDWAFSKITYVILLEDTEEIAEVKVLNSDGNSYVLVHPESNCILLWCSDVDSSAIQKVIQLESEVQAPVTAGQVLGSMELKFSGETIATIPLIAIGSVDRSWSNFNLYALENFPNSPWFRYGIVAGCILTGLYIALCIYAAYRAKRSVIPEDPIHLIPHTTDFQDAPQRRNWKRDDTVFYHGPDRSEKEQEEWKTKQTSDHFR